MAKSSIHIAKGGSGYLAHNSRETPTNNSIFDTSNNFCSSTTKDSFEIYRHELALRTKAYAERTKQSLQKNTITHLSAIVNLNANTSLEDIKKLIEHLESKLDTKVFQFAIHRDEGHIADNGEPQINHHAHIEFLGIDSKGNSVRKKLTRGTLKELQTETANILGMERGKEGSRAKRLDTYDFKQAKKTEQENRIELKQQHANAINNLRAKHKEKKEDLKDKIREFQDYYKLSSSERDKALATIQDLKLVNTQLREQIKATNTATQQDYQTLKTEIDTLKAEIKTKNLTIADLENFKNNYALKINSLTAENTQLKEQLQAKPKEVVKVVEVPKIVEKIVHVEVPKYIEMRDEEGNSYKDLYLMQVQINRNTLKTVEEQKTTIDTLKSTIEQNKPNSELLNDKDKEIAKLERSLSVKDIVYQGVCKENRELKTLADDLRAQIKDLTQFVLDIKNIVKSTTDKALDSYEAIKDAVKDFFTSKEPSNAQKISDFAKESKLSTAERQKALAEMKEIQDELKGIREMGR